MNTKYAPPERSDDEVIRLQSSWFHENKLLTEVLDAVPDVIFVLNQTRQIIYANAAINKRFKNINIAAVVGQRPGEVLNCEYAFKEIAGCGTSEFCRTCGSVNAALAAIKGVKNEQECRIIQLNTLDSLDLRVYASPISLNETAFTIFTVTDISDEKRRQALEKIFFHDILNTAGGLRGLIELIKDNAYDKTDEIMQLLFETSERIIDEISTQKELSDAEGNDLRINPSQFNSLDLLKDVNQFLKNYDFNSNKILKINSDSENIQITTDKTLLRRVMINLVKNALESSNENELIITSCHLVDNMIEFTVWNNCFMPKDVQNQIFQRSFSTKGRGRGLGTYSIKLLTEKYLGGTVYFTSSVKNGTLFSVKIPIS